MSSFPGQQSAMTLSPKCSFCGGTNTEIADTGGMGHCNDCDAGFVTPPAGTGVGDVIMASLAVEIDNETGLRIMSLVGGRTIEPAASDLVDSTGNSLPKSIMGFPVTYVWKDLSSVGPWQTAKGEDFTVTDARIDRWIGTFMARQEYGAKVPIVDDHRETAVNGNGWLIKVKKDGSRLMGLMQVVGQSAALKVASNDVSVATDDMTDGNRQTHMDALRHVALTPMPMNPGLTSPKLAASRAGARKRTLPSPVTGGSMPMLKCSDTCMSGLHGLVPGLADVPEEGKMDAIHSHLKTMSQDDSDDAMDDGDTSESMSRMARPAIIQKARTKRKNALKLAARVPILEEQVRQMSGITEAIKPLEPDMDEMIRDSLEDKKNRCIERGALSEAVADELLMSLVGSTEKPNFFGMSRIVTEAGKKVPAAAVVFDILAANAPPKGGMGRQTDPQHQLTMSRRVAGADVEVERDPMKAVGKFHETLGTNAKTTL